MSLIELGVTGRRAFETTSPRFLLKHIMDSHNGASEQDLFELFKTEIADDDDFISSIVKSWFKETYQSLSDIAKQRAKHIERPERKQQIAQIKEVIKARATQIVLLEMIMPNGKPLADCTGQECAKAGGWLCRVAMKIGPDERVGDALSENELRKLHG